MEKIFIDPHAETPIRVGGSAGFAYRYAYARAAESRMANEPGQDFLCFTLDQQTLVFALSDGVGQSFFGDLAARFLAGALVDWLAGDAPTDSSTFCTSLAHHLRQLTTPAGKLVQDHSLPADLAPILRQVLEEKRAHGSESTFVCGRIDLPRKELPQGNIRLAWMGDTRLRLWGAEGEINVLPADSFRTNQRWSTRRGPVNGEPHCYVGALTGIMRVAAYSDGLAVLDRGDVSEGDQSLTEIIAAEQRAPQSDDIAFLAVAIKEPVVADPAVAADLAAALPPPRQIWLAVREGRLQAAWPPVAGAASYQVLLVGGSEPQSFQTDQPSWQSEATLAAGEYDVQVRALRGSRAGAWSLPAKAVEPGPKPAAVTAATAARPAERRPTARAAVILIAGLLVVLACSAVFWFLPPLLSGWSNVSEATPTSTLTATAVGPTPAALTPILVTTPTLAPTVSPVPVTETATIPPSASMTASPTPSQTATASATATMTATPTTTTPTISITATATLSVTGTVTGTVTTSTPTATPTSQSPAVSLHLSTPVLPLLAGVKADVLSER